MTKIKLSFIENDLGIRLNNTCFNGPSAFWGNGGWETNRQKRAWISHGYIVEDYHINAQTREGQGWFKKVR